MSDVDVVRLDLNNPVFQRDLLGLQKVERHAALDTLAKLRQLNWQQVYRDKGLHWEKIVSIKPPPGIAALYSVRITQTRRSVSGWRIHSFAGHPLGPRRHLRQKVNHTDAAEFSRRRRWAVDRTRRWSRSLRPLQSRSPTILIRAE